MKFSVSSDILRDRLNIVGGAIASNPVLPILEDFLFTVKGNRLHIAATDLETTISLDLEVNADADGSVAIPAKILQDTLKALPVQPLTFTVDMDNFGVEITSAYGKYKLSGESGDDFPKIPMAEDVDTVDLPARILHKGVVKTLFATSSDELRLAMTGVFFQIDFNSITFVATDAHKLVRYTFDKHVESNVSTSFILPKKALNLLKNALPGGDEKVRMSFNKSNAFFEYESIKLVCRMVDARYPDYNAVIPTDNPNKMSITRSDFQNSLKRIAIYANKTTNQVVLNITDSSLTVEAQDLDFSNAATEQLPCSFEGASELTIGFNAKFMAEMLGVLETDQISLEMSTPSRAGIILPQEQVDGENLLMLVMPVMLGN
jgi:DNA polymerase-3 subunit beta